VDCAKSGAAWRSARSGVVGPVGLCLLFLLASALLRRPAARKASGAATVGRNGGFVYRLSVAQPGRSELLDCVQQRALFYAPSVGGGASEPRSIPIGQLADSGGADISYYSEIDEFPRVQVEKKNRFRHHFSYSPISHIPIHFSLSLTFIAAGSRHGQFEERCVGRSDAFLTFDTMLG
jgi:hypothetical protein